MALHQAATICGIGFFHRFAPATFADTIATSLGASATGLGVLAAGHFWIYTAAQIPAGMVLDRYGARSSVAAASAVVALGSVLLATAGGLVQATCGPILTGLGMSAVFVGVMRFNAQAFPAHRYGLVTSVAMLIANVGSIAAGSPTALLIEHWSRRTLFGVASLVSAVLAVMVCSRRRP
ncbi:MFS transporter [Nocardiopsis rhodophaea]|uniref:MFS transporter n=1 Tax=Nocardiopsis rhodophaea TaxID=280238 RepID=UPI0031E17995